MTHYSTSARFTSGQADALYIPRVYGKAKPVVVYMPGQGDFPTSGLRSAKPTLDVLVAAGFCVVQPTVSGFFGNDTASAPTTGRVAQAVAWAKANLPVKDADPVIVGISNGAICGMSYARQNPVAALVTVIMPPDLEYVRAGDVGGNRAAIDTAWGVTYPAALPAHADILTDKAAYVGKPVQAWVSSNDPLNNTATGHSEHEFATYIGAEFHDLGAVGHADTSWGPVDPAAVLTFINARV